MYKHVSLVYGNKCPYLLSPAWYKRATFYNNDQSLNIGVIKKGQNEMQSKKNNASKQFVIIISVFAV